jgi:hypothetical protein
MMKKLLLSLLILLMAGNVYAVDTSQYMYERIAEVVGASYIKGFWVFDATGTATTVTDRSGNGHTITLGGAASTLSPSYAGYAPSLTMAGTAATSWSAASSDDFRPSVGSGFTVIMLANPTAMASFGISRYEAGQAQWLFHQAGAAFYFIQHGALDASIYQGRSVATPVDTGAWHCYAGTWDGTVGASGSNIYRDGVAIDTDDANAGVFVDTQASTSRVGSFFTANYSSAKYSIVLIISRELTAGEVLQVSTILRTYIGDGIPPFDLLAYEQDN